ncbi:MAG: MraY family glycosyltransferase [Bacteroidales bacterium]
MLATPLEWLDITRIACAFAVSLVLCIGLIPKINYIARSKGLLNHPDTRTSHRYGTPNFGGVSVFLAFTVAFMLFLKCDTILAQNFKYLSLSFLFIFFVGLKDDIMVMSAEKKLMAQIFVAVLLVYGGIHFTNLHGLFNIGELNELTSVILSTFVIIVLINAFNLIDGIDGLASLLGSIILTVFGFWFYINHIIDWAVICFSMVGALFAFFFFNVYGLRNKTFLGDSGSLLLGLVVAAVVIQFNESNLNPLLPYRFLSAPAVSFGIIILPVVDVARVFFIRILEGHSPFAADKNHFHHRLLDLGCSHIQATFVLCGVSAIFIGVSLLMNSCGILKLLAVLVGMVLIFIAILEYLHYKWMKKKEKEMRTFVSHDDV